METSTLFLQCMICSYEARRVNREVLFPRRRPADARPARIERPTLQRQQLVQPVVGVKFILLGAQRIGYRIVAPDTVAGTVKPIFHTLQIRTAAILDPPLVYHPPKPVQPCVLITPITHRWASTLLDVGQFHVVLNFCKASIAYSLTFLFG